jgi:DNA-binding FadR family transcriptional regulator
VRPLSFVLSLSDGGLDQLFEARKVVEPAMAALAARRIDDATLDRLDALAMPAGAVLESAEAFLVADAELHDAIREPAGNAILGRFMESIQALASRQTAGSKREVRDHEAIVAALRSRDPDAARPRCTATWRTSSARGGPLDADRRPDVEGRRGHTFAAVREQAARADHTGAPASGRRAR